MPKIKRYIVIHVPGIWMVDYSFWDPRSEYYECGA